jgi:hypothetical protein
MGLLYLYLITYDYLFIYCLFIGQVFLIINSSVLHIICFIYYSCCVTGVASQTKIEGRIAGGDVGNGHV